MQNAELFNAECPPSAVLHPPQYCYGGRVLRRTGGMRNWRKRSTFPDFAAICTFSHFIRYEIQPFEKLKIESRKQKWPLQRGARNSGRGIRSLFPCLPFPCRCLWFSPVSFISKLNFELLRLITTYYEIWLRCISSYFELFRPISTYFGLFRPIST